MPYELIPPPPTRPGDPIVISWSEIQTGRNCPHKHDLQYGRRWSKVQPDHTALGRGILWHLLMEVHYTALKEKRDPRPDTTELFEAWAHQGRNPEVLDLLRWMYRGHLEMYGLDTGWEILATEFAFRQRLLLPDGSPSRFEIKGRIDLAVRDLATGRTHVVDFKTCAQLPNRELDLDDQMGIYLWAVRKLGRNPHSAIYAAAKTTRNKGDADNAVADWEAAKARGEKAGARPKPQNITDRFVRYSLPRTDHELDTVAAEVLATAEYLYSDQNRKQRHPDTDRCRWMCGMLEACMLGRKTDQAREDQFLHDTGWVQDYRRH